MGSLKVEAGLLDSSVSIRRRLASAYNWTKVWGISGDQGDAWQFGTVILPPNTEKIRFVATTGNNYQSDIAVDDVLISEVSTHTQYPFYVH